MTGVTRYLVTRLFGATLFITFAVTGVVWLSQSLRFIDLIINRGLSVVTFLELTLLLLPTFLAVIVPLALFCAVMYTYHRLTVDSELVVLRADEPLVAFGEEPGSKLLIAAVAHAPFLPGARRRQRRPPPHRRWHRARA